MKPGCISGTVLFPWLYSPSQGRLAVWIQEGSKHLVRHCCDPGFVPDPQDQAGAIAGLVPVHWALKKKKTKNSGRQILSPDSPPLHKIKMFRANRGTLMGHKGQAAAGHNLTELPLSFWPGKISCIFLLIELNPILLSLYFKIFGVFRITIIPS